MEARLEYCGNYIEITNFHHSVDDEKNGNPYNCSFDIKVKSGVFSGIADGCEYDYKELQKFIKALEDMILFKRKEITFVEIGYGNKIEFNCDKSGHIKVFGAGEWIRAKNRSFVEGVLWEQELLYAD